MSLTYDGTPKSATATTSPGSLAVTYMYNGSTTVPTAAGTYMVVGTINDANFQGSASGTLTIQQDGQTISFPPPNPGGVGAAFGLSASSSSGLAVTYMVTGNARLSGSTLTLLDANPVTVTASQGGNSNFLAALPVSQSISATSKLAQTITVGTLPNNASNAKPFTLNSTAASSGLSGDPCSRERPGDDLRLNRDADGPVGYADDRDQPGRRRDLGRRTQ